MAWSGKFDDFSNYSAPNTNNNSHKQSSNGNQGFVALPQGVQQKIIEITPNVPTVNIIGVVLTKDGPKSIITKKGSGSERFLLSLTIRDSPDAFINCTCWGNEGFIIDLAKTVRIGDVVEVKNAQVQSKPMNQIDDRYKPWTPSGFQLNLSENHSSVALYSGWDLSTFVSLKHIPTKPSNDYYTLEDVNVNGTSLQGEHINLLVAVKQVWPARNITTRTGKQTRKCDVVLCDETCTNFSLTLWDGMVDFALTWVPRETILFASDVKIQYNDYKGCMSATASSKTIFTVDPDTPEGHILYQFIRSQTDLGSSFLAETDSNEQDPELSSIKDVYTVDQVKQWCNEASDQQGCVQYGVMYAFLTTFDIDGDKSTIFRHICCKCRKEMKADSGFICTNDQCPGGDPMSTDVSGLSVEFNLTLSLSDHTGSLSFCHLNGSTAEVVLGCKAKDFQNIDVQKKTEIKWSLLLERCRIILKMKKIRSDDFKTRSSFRVLSLTRADPAEIVQSNSSTNDSFF